MTWLLRLQLSPETCEALTLGDCHDWHRYVWTAFPGRPKNQRCFVFRVDERESGRVLTVLSTEMPERPGDCPLEAWHLCRLDPEFFRHRYYRFDTLVNATRRFAERDAYGGREPKGRRFPICGEAPMREWLARKGEQHGFRVYEDELNWLEIEPRRDYRFKRGGLPGVIVGTRLRGLLEVTDPVHFLAAAQGGIGHGRGFGFGLLLLQPVLL